MRDLVSLFAIMDAQVGVAETPAHSNVVQLRGFGSLWRDFWGLSSEPGWPWCACFQSWADWMNGTPLPAIDGPRGYISVDSGRAWFRRNGLLVPAPQSGYLVFYNEHTGRVRSLNADGTFWSLEGNEGDAVRLILRDPSEVVGGFGVRTYADVPAPPLPAPPEEDDMSEHCPAGQQRMLTWTPGREAVLIAASDHHPPAGKDQNGKDVAGANVRLAAGNEVDGFPIVFEGWIPARRIGWPLPKTGGVVNAENLSGPNGFVVAVEYA